MATIGKEYTLSIDKANKPVELSGLQTINALLTRLILLEPGTYQSNPEMGIGIVSRYRYGNEDDIENLSSDIKDQIQTYLPGFERVEVQIQESDLDKKILVIRVTLNDIIYDVDISTPSLTVGSDFKVKISTEKYLTVTMDLAGHDVEINIAVSAN